ncbi:hypothetical protein TNIN_342691 [Trichonephila inaurata madagascariensis]|uniref:Uncharacterized protein n=1 Tax=Trichonephila inaurata madagascariensis TaxID=2747483 RepID=A0A8X6XBI2_9ARAC|nr:hypothetical protein TNIN_342691 [Trichonephila inaurata madagascariensis]
MDSAGYFQMTGENLHSEIKALFTRRENFAWVITQMKLKILTGCMNRRNMFTKRLETFNVFMSNLKGENTDAWLLPDYDQAQTPLLGSDRYVSKTFWIFSDISLINTNAEMISYD